MKHNVKELYTIYNNTGTNIYATEAYLKEKNIPCFSASKAIDIKYQGKVVARSCRSIVNRGKKPVNVLDANGKKQIFLFGEKTWFDTAEELEEYRNQYHAERNEALEKNKIKKEIISILDGMERQDLEILLTKLS
jgi:hypothetical protein